MAKRILLADDSVTAQNMGRKILSDAGYEVLTVNNGSAALKRIAEQKPEIIILDVYMPGYSGLEVCQRLKEAQETAAIPVLLTVGKLEPFKAEEAKRVHADAFIIKPFEATELLTVLAKLEDKIAPQPVGKATQKTQGKSSQSKATQAKGSPARPEAEAPAGKKVPVEVVASPAKIEKPAKPEAETDWKDRLRIPIPATANAEEERYGRPTAFHDLRVPGTAQAEAPEEPSFAVNLPPDITSEELAAIREAVASLSGEVAPAAEQEQEEEGPAEAARPAEIAEIEAALSAPEFATTFAAVPVESEVPVAEHIEAFTAAPVVETAVAESVAAIQSHQDTEESEAVEESEALASAPEPVEEVEYEPAPAAALEEHAAPEPVPAPEGRLSETEVADALAALGPLGGVQFEGIVSAEAHAGALASHGVEVYPRGHGSLVEELYSARWIAEEVPLDESVSGLILEQEMQKVYAESGSASAHAETAVAEAEVPYAASHTESARAEEEIAAEAIDAQPGATGAVSWEAVEASHAQEHEVAEPAPVAAADLSAEETAAVEDLGLVAKAEAEVPADAVAEQTAAVPEPAMEAEFTSSAAPEPALEAQPSEEFEASAAPEVADAVAVAEIPHDSPSEAVNVEAVAAPGQEALSQPEPSEPEQAEVAAAASVGHDASADSLTAVPSDTNAEDEQPPDVAAAWARWRQIRDSLSSPEFTAQLADAAAAELAAAQAQHDAAIHPEVPSDASGSNGDFSVTSEPAASGQAASDFKDIRENRPAAPPAEASALAAAAAASSSAADSAVISNIVESVLAELKPKLVEEIARKLAKK